MRSFRTQVRRLRFRMALSFLAFLILAQGMAEGFVLRIGSHGKTALELESEDGNASRQEKGLFSVISCKFDGSTSRYLDISFVEEFPPLPSTVEPPVFLDHTQIGYPSLLTSIPLSKPRVLHRDDTPEGRSPLGPDPLATVRLIL